MWTVSYRRLLVEEEPVGGNMKRVSELIFVCGGAPILLKLSS